MSTMVMIDLETLSDHSDAIILSIGAVKFTIEDGIVDEFYTNVSHLEQLEMGFHKSQRTVDWWKEQDPEAFKSLLKNRVHIRVALENFSRWYGNKSMPTWSKGASFDLPIMAQAYRKVYGEDAKTPWKYWDGVCMRTVELWYPMQKEERIGVYHNALDDAKTQTNHLLKFYSKFGIID